MDRVPAARPARCEGRRRDGGNRWRRIAHVGCPDHLVDAPAVLRDLVDGSRSDAFDGTVMRVVVLASILAVGLFLYLVVALLRPELFV